MHATQAANMSLLAAELSQREVELARLQAEVARLARELEVVLESPTWRAGRVVTSVPRAVRELRER